MKRERSVDINITWKSEDAYFCHTIDYPIAIVLTHQVDTTIGPLQFRKAPFALQALDSLRASDPGADWFDYIDEVSGRIFMNKNRDSLFVIDPMREAMTAIDIGTIVGSNRKAVVVPLSNSRCFAVPRRQDGTANSVLIFDLKFK